MRRAALVGPAVALLLAGTMLLPATVHAEPPAGAAVLAAVPHCAASIEAATRGILGGSSVATAEGFRVQDLVVDPVLRKAWVRVADCHDTRKPLTLVPLFASLAVSASTPVLNASAPPPTVAIGSAEAQTAPFAAALPAPPAPVLIARGDAVDVLVQSASVRMALQGHAASAAAAGEAVDVVLDPAGSNEPNSPARHLRGIAAGAHRVEVRQ